MLIAFVFGMAVFFTWQYVNVVIAYWLLTRINELTVVPAQIDGIKSMLNNHGFRLTATVSWTVLYYLLN